MHACMQQLTDVCTVHRRYQVPVYLPPLLLVLLVLLLATTTPVRCQQLQQQELHHQYIRTRTPTLAVQVAGSRYEMTIYIHQIESKPIGKNSLPGHRVSYHVRVIIYRRYLVQQYSETRNQQGTTHRTNDGIPGTRWYVFNYILLL